MNSDLVHFRARLAGQSGPQLWRSLEELGNTPEFRACLEREFPVGASEWPEQGTASDGGMGRRQFLTMVGASLALAGFAGCSPRSREKIVPYVDQPEQIIPGRGLLYATAMPLNGYGRGILVETEMGRPIKIEGNPAHPDSLGATDAVTQAAVLGLWDPDRSQAPFFNGHISTWNKFESELLTVLKTAGDAQGEGLAVLTEPSTSPTLSRQRNELLKEVSESALVRVGTRDVEPRASLAGSRLRQSGFDRRGGQRFPDGSTGQPALHAAVRRAPPGARTVRPQPNRLYVLGRDADHHRHDGGRAARRAAGPRGGGAAASGRQRRAKSSTRREEAIRGETVGRTWRNSAGSNASLSVVGEAEPAEIRAVGRGNE